MEESPLPDVPAVHLQQVPAPPWAAQDVTFAPHLLPEDHHTVTEQLAAIHQAVQAALRWAITEGKGNIWLDLIQSELRDASGQYFVGRHFVDHDLESPGSYIVETECCFLQTGTHRMYVHPRYTVTLRWNGQERTGTPQLARQTARASQLARLTYRVVRTERPQHISGHDALSQEEQAFLASRWADVLECVQQAVREAVEDESASGELDNNFFPSRLRMTGEYYIESLSSLSGEALSFMLHFLELPYFEGQVDFDYLGYDLSIKRSNGSLAYELWGHSAI
ncbi:hypothetical protein MF271_22270 (plasmid) [Deinococcus sp. KNUC1210]|uniref:hypothetical protein n=1 Tax=Deinococcus sp. KNUC1210 TaxID=2917691 RepID=UPI001EEF805C|nr:hypothetical protein [Deinococcus sp. KNUC1210]ULH18198.1 hypothetical protein MF271_22270 [Deinococcus sp. KNUC1210]